MTLTIKKVGVIGSGTMGAAIAAHVANAGIPVVLLDIVPTKLTPEQETKGLLLTDTVVRNSIVTAGFDRTLKARPASFMSKAAISLVKLGNLEDNLDWLADADWIVEAIIEKLEPKRALMEKLEAIRKPGSIITSNTSGLPIASLAEGRGADFKAHFLGTHFFNPPRYMKLLEIIPIAESNPDVVAAMVAFAENALGKGIVTCKDTPNFIGNRMMSIDGAFTAHYAFSNGYTIEEVDAITGPLIGRPKTATFRLQDLIGIDIASFVANNLYDLIPDDPYRDVIKSSAGTKLIEGLIERGWLGRKTGHGFYKRGKDAEGQTVFLVIDPETFDYVPAQKVRFDSVGAVRKIEDIGARLKALFSDEWAEDRGAQLARAIVGHQMAYAAAKVPEITASFVNIDNAIRWGFSYEAGPFELWDKLGVADTIALMEADGLTVAPWVKAMVTAGFDTFYQYENEQAIGYFNLDSQTYHPLNNDPRQINLDQLRAIGKAVKRNAGASILDMGDGVLLLEFHAKMNAIDEDIVKMMVTARELLEQNETVGLVIGNQGENFCVGANIFPIAMAAQQNMPEQIQAAVKAFQNALMAFRYSPKPVVVAPFGMTLGGGAEVVLAGSRRVAHAESYIGLVEVGVGLIPAGGGIKEMVRRTISKEASQNPLAETLPTVEMLFQIMGQAKVGSSAAESKENHFLDDNDRIIMNKDHLLYEAKQEVLKMVAAGYTPPPPAKIWATGRDMLAALKMGVWSYQESGVISEYDAVIGRKLAHVLTGGNLSAPQWVSEQYFLDLEREAFVELAMQPKTIERIWHMLQNGKPLRN